MVRFAIKSGNWSDPTVWDNGALPLSTDDVYPNGFTVTIDQNVTVANLLNAPTPLRLPNLATVKMVTNISESGEAIATGTPASGNQPYYAFDQNTTGYNIWIVTGLGSIGFKFNSQKTIRKYGFFTNSTPTVTSPPQTWNFEGSNDGVNWTILDSKNVTLAGSSYYAYAIPNTTAYTYYRMNILTKNGGSPLCVAELEMTESTVSVIGGVSGGTFTLNGGVTVNAIVNGGATTTPTITYSAASPAASIINGNISGSSTNGTVSHTGTGTLTINGNLTGSAIAGSAVGLLAAGILNINGNLTNGEASGNYSTGFTAYAASVGGTVNITGNVLNSNGTSNLINTAIRIQANVIINIVGNVVGTVPTGGTSNARNTIVIDSVCTLNITGTVYGGSWGITTVNLAAIQCNTSSTINITGEVYGNSLGQARGIYFNGGTITVTGNVIGGSSTSTGAAIDLQTASTVNVNGTIRSTGSNAAVYANNASPINVNGFIISSSGSPAIVSNNTSCVLTMSGNLINNANGTMAVQVYKMYLTNTPSSWKFTNAVGGTNTALYTSNYAPNYPSPYDVKTGVSYNGGAMVGIMNVPPVGTVVEGVPVGTTVGTALLSKAGVQAAVWDKNVSELSVADSIGLRVKNSLTNDTLGQQLAAFNP